MRKSASLLHWLFRWLGIHAAIVLIVIGAIVVGVLLLPLSALSTTHRSVQAQRALVSKSVQFYLWVLKRSGLMAIEYRGFTQTLDSSGALFVATHPSLFDVLFFLAKFPTCGCVVKPQLYTFSPYAPIIRRAKYIISGRDDVVAAAVSELEQGHPLIIFPEGTRSDAFSSSENRLQRGAAAIALRSHRPLHLVRITSNPAALGKTRRWYEVPLKKCLVTVELFQTIQPTLEGGETPQLAARRLTNEIESLFFRVDN